MGFLPAAFKFSYGQRSKCADLSELLPSFFLVCEIYIHPKNGSGKFTKKNEKIIETIQKVLYNDIKYKIKGRF